VSNRFSPPKNVPRLAVGGDEDSNLAAAPTYLALHAPLSLPQIREIREHFLSALVEREFL
jgi:hypothetical protein